MSQKTENLFMNLHQCCSLLMFWQNDSDLALKNGAVIISLRQGGNFPNEATESILHFRSHRALTAKIVPFV